MDTEYSMCTNDKCQTCSDKMNPMYILDTMYTSYDFIGT